MSRTRNYILKSGKYTDADGKRYVPGDEVSLTDAQADSFKDLIVPALTAREKAAIKEAEDAERAAAEEEAKKAEAEAKKKAEEEAKKNPGKGKG